MKVKDLIKKLKKCDQNSSMIFYYLKDANLSNCEYETLFDFDEGGENDGQGRVELTIKLENSNENGNMENEKNND